MRTYLQESKSYQDLALLRPDRSVRPDQKRRHRFFLYSTHLFPRQQNLIRQFQHQLMFLGIVLLTYSSCCVFHNTNFFPLKLLLILLPFKVINEAPVTNVSCVKSTISLRESVLVVEPHNMSIKLLLTVSLLALKSCRSSSRFLSSSP